MLPWASEGREGGAAGLSLRLLGAAGSPTMSGTARAGASLLAKVPLV